MFLNFCEWTIKVENTLVKPFNGYFSLKFQYFYKAKSLHLKQLLLQNHGKKNIKMIECTKSK